jgi:cytochrome c2
MNIHDINYIGGLQEENARLKAEVERLTKAGDAMASSIQFNEEMSQDYNGPTIVHQCVQCWNAAKEGKQSK